jgi:hypothetical protein
MTAQTKIEAVAKEVITSMSNHSHSDILCAAMTTDYAKNGWVAPFLPLRLTTSMQV